MEAMETIKGRRTHLKFDTKPIEKKVIESLLECAVYAPNHLLTEPWRFYVLTGSKKNELAEQRRKARLATLEDPTSEKGIEAANQAYSFMADVPVVIAVTTQKSPDNPNREKEDYAAVSCAVQNMLLAAWDHGIGSYWGTGPLTKKPIAYEIIGANETEEEIVGFIFFGYPKEEPVLKERNYGEKTVWYWED